MNESKENGATVICSEFFLDERTKDCNKTSCDGKEVNSHIEFNGMVPRLLLVEPHRGSVYLPEEIPVEIFIKQSKYNN